MASNFFTTTCSLDIGILLLKTFSWTQCQPNHKHTISFAPLLVHPLRTSRLRFLRTLPGHPFRGYPWPKRDGHQHQKSLEHLVSNSMCRWASAMPRHCNPNQPSSGTCFFKGHQRKGHSRQQPFGDLGSNGKQAFLQGQQVNNLPLSKPAKRVPWCSSPALPESAELDRVTSNTFEHGEDVKTCIGSVSPESLGSEAVRDLGANLSHAYYLSLAST